MRPLSELLQLVYDELNHQDNVNGNKRESIYYTGICDCKSYLYRQDIISFDETKLIHRYIYDNAPNKRFSIMHFWKPFKLAYRNKWLKKHIKINKLKENNN